MLVMISVVGCAPGKYLDPRLSNLTLDYLETNCVPEDKHDFFMQGVEVITSRTKACAGYDDLFIVSWKGEQSDFNVAMANFLAQMYVRYENDAKEQKIAATFLKKTNIKSANISSNFYRITKK